MFTARPPDTQTRVGQMAGCAVESRRVNYRQTVPYPLRYLIAVAAWALIVVADLLLRMAFLPFMPVLWLRSWQTQPNSQLLTDAADFIYRPMRRFPKVDWHRLFLRRQSRRGPAASRSLTGKSVPLE